MTSNTLPLTASNTRFCFTPSYSTNSRGVKSRFFIGSSGFSRGGGGGFLNLDCTIFRMIITIISNPMICTGDERDLMKFNTGETTFSRSILSKNFTAARQSYDGKGFWVILVTCPHVSPRGEWSFQKCESRKTFVKFLRSRSLDFCVDCQRLGVSNLCKVVSDYRSRSRILKGKKVLGSQRKTPVSLSRSLAPLPLATPNNWQSVESVNNQQIIVKLNQEP